jgi:hypothetical protein
MLYSAELPDLNYFSTSPSDLPAKSGMLHSAELPEHIVHDPVKWVSLSYALAIQFGPQTLRAAKIKE